MFKYELIWHDGTKEIVVGTSISNAFAAAGYSGGAIAALDSYSCIGKA